MTNSTIIPDRAGHTNAQEGAEQAHILIVLVQERPGAVDRVVGVLRRRRANMQTLVLGRSERPDIVRITVSVSDSEVGLGHLVEQLRKVVDVQQVYNLSAQQAVTREIALIRINSEPQRFNEIVELAHHFGAHVVDVAPDTMTLEVSGSAEKVQKLVGQLQAYGIREMARSGSVTMSRATA